MDNNKNATINLAQAIIHIESFAAQVKNGEGLNLTAEQKEYAKKEMEKPHVQEHFNKLADEISKLRATVNNANNGANNKTNG